MGIIKLITTLLRSTLGKIVGLGFSLSVIISILKLTPDQWTNNLGAWTATIRSINTNILWMIAVTLLVAGFYQIYKQNEVDRSVDTQSKSENSDEHKTDGGLFVTYSKEEMGIILRRLIEQEEADEIRVFAYTAETLRDYIAYSDRYRHITLKVLIRNWIVEKREEEIYNAELAKRDPNMRLWKKWRKIKTLSQEYFDEMKSDLTYRLQVRFYDNAPFFKGIIVSSRKNGRREAFLGLYKWFEWPVEGGSRYKGEGAVALHLRSDRSEKEAIVLDRFISQFERAWLVAGHTYEQVMYEDTSLE